jgi:proteasome lid subunit RPN8/RPN11
LDKFATVGGSSVHPDELTQTAACLLARHVASGRQPFVRLVECRRNGAEEAVVVDVEVELGQELAHDIRPIERIALIWAEQGAAPVALALRQDFPSVPHLVLGPPESPKILCLYDEPWSEVRLDWTPVGFIERIRGWLARNARGQLHAEDQPLEPLLTPTPFILVLPADFFDTASGGTTPARLSVTLVDPAKPRVLIAQRSSGKKPDQNGKEFVLTGFRCHPQPHGVVHFAPGNLADLHSLLAPTGCDLLADLRQRLALWAPESEVMAARLIIAVAMPKTRNPDGEIEAEDLWAFMTASTVAEVGIAIGCLEPAPSDLRGAPRIARKLPFQESKRGEDTRIELVTPVLAFDRRAAARNAGFATPDNRRIVAVGCGALGSHVAINLAREGFGLWTLVDPDCLLPHNLARHVATGMGVGYAKTEVMAWLLKNIFDEEVPVATVQADVLDPRDARETLESAFAEADLILDMSASVAVARHLAHDVRSSARRISLFFNPAGTDLVLLAEDADRSIPLDALEMQYYQAVVALPELDGHLAPPAARLRYAHSCRDITSTIPQSRVALLSAIAGLGVRNAAGNSAATIAAWRCRKADFGVDAIRHEARPRVVEYHGEWEMRIDQHLLEQLHRQRAERLPNETGGVLIGAFDAQRRIVHIVETIPSPPDSEEWPTLYIRGAEGLADRLRQIQDSTLGRLRYVGEWHSHPDGCGCQPSAEDRRALAWLAENMAAEGLPGLMAIVGQSAHMLIITTTVEES